MPGAEGTLKVAEPKRDKLEIFNEALKEAASEPKGEAVTKKAADEEGRAQGRGARCRARCRARLPRRPRRPPRCPASETPEGATAEAEAEEAAEKPATDPTEAERDLSAMLAEALEHLVRGVVDHPDDVSVRDKQLRRGSILEVRVHPDDLGKVIGRGGRTATAFRTVVSALAGRGGARVDFVDVDRR